MLSRMLGSAMLGVAAVFATVAWLGEVEDAKPLRRLALEPGRIAGRLVDEDGSAVTNGRVPQSKAQNDHEHIRALEGELRRCGKDGKVTLSAKYVLDTGVLFQPVVRVTGSAAADPKVKECAQRLAERLRLLPRKAPSEFSSLTVSLE